MSIDYLLSQNYRYHMREADYHIGHKELCFTLFILLISDDPPSGKPCFFIFSNSQMKIPSPYSSFLLERQFSTLVLKFRLVQIKCWTEQWRGLTWDDSYMTMDTGAGGKPQPPPMQHRHIYSRVRQLEEISSGQEARTPAGSRRANSSSFPPFLLALVMFILPDPDTSQKDVTTSETNSSSVYFLHLF